MLATPRSKRKIAFGLAVLVALFALPAFAQEEDENLKALAAFVAKPGILVRALTLTAEQQATLRTQVTTARSTIKPLRTDIKNLTDQIRDALGQPNPDACAVGALVVTRHGKYEDIEDALLLFDHDFSAILTPTQLTKYEALKDLFNHRP